MSTIKSTSDSLAVRMALHIHFSPDFEIGGAERRLIRIHNELAKSMVIDLYVRGCDEVDFHRRMRQAGCDVDCFHRIYCFKLSLRKIANLAALSHFALRGRLYGAVGFFDCNRFNIGIAKISKRLKIRSLSIIANYLYGLRSYSDADMKRLEKMVRLVDRVDVLYPNQQKFYENISGRRNVTVTPGTFTDLHAFEPSQKRKLILFNAARLDYVKNPRLLIEACNLCSDNIRAKGYSVSICGTNGDYEQLKKLVGIYGLSDVIDMPGYIDPTDYLPFAEVFCSLSELENYPSQAVAEAIACGCFVIATDVGDTSLMLDSLFSQVIEPTPEALSQSLITFLNSCQREKAGYVTAARAFAESRFNIKESLAYFRNLYEAMGDEARDGLAAPQKENDS